jgi:hypothetical protein
MLGRGAQLQLSRARWDGQVLAITTHHTFADPISGKPLTMEVQQSLTLVSPTSLRIEVTRAGVLGGKATTTRTVYRKG